MGAAAAARQTSRGKKSQKGRNACVNANGNTNGKADFRVLCDGETNIILRLDLVTSKSHQRRNAFADEGEGSRHAAPFLRLCEPYFNSGRIVHASHMFSSLKICLLAQANGLHFMGKVQDKRKEFPVDYVRSKGRIYDELNRSSSATSPTEQPWSLLKSSQRQGGLRHDPVYVLGWHRDGDMDLVVSTCGSTARADEDYETKKIRRKMANGHYEAVYAVDKMAQPSMAEEQRSFLSSVSTHDCYRCEILELERKWTADKWYQRVFRTIFGICVVDAYFAHKHDMANTNHDACEFSYFIGRLANQLIFNSLFNDGRAPPATAPASAPAPTPSENEKKRAELGRERARTDQEISYSNETMPEVFMCVLRINPQPKGYEMFAVEPTLDRLSR